MGQTVQVFQCQISFNRIKDVFADCKHWRRMQNKHFRWKIYYFWFLFSSPLLFGRSKKFYILSKIIETIKAKHFQFQIFRLHLLSSTELSMLLRSISNVFSFFFQLEQNRKKLDFIRFEQKQSTWFNSCIDLHILNVH